MLTRRGALTPHGITVRRFFLVGVEPLIKSSADCVAGKMRMDARRARKVVAGTKKPRSATPQTPHFAATRRDGASPGGLLCRSACQGE